MNPAWWIGACLAVIVSALCTLTSSALNRITRSEAAEAYSEGAKHGEKIVLIVSRRPAALAGVAAVRVLAIIIYTICLTTAIEPWFDVAWERLGVVVGISVILYAVVALISPTSIGTRHPVATLGAMATGLNILTAISSLFVRHKDRKELPEEEEAQVKEDQLAVMVDRVSESEVLEEDERRLLQSVFALGRTLVREVMVPRTDMITIASGTTLEKAIRLFTRSGYSRIPVIGESVDDIKGVLYLKDVMLFLHQPGASTSIEVDRDTPVDAVMREPVFVPETKIVDELMRDMQAHAIHIALVVDEYGGIAGLVTIEDLLEELVGEMIDEHDRALQEIEEITDGVYRVPSRLPLDDLGELFNVKIEDDDVDTVGGLLAKALGRVPIAGASTTINGIELEAERFQGRRKRLATMIVRREEEVDEDD